MDFYFPPGGAVGGPVGRQRRAPGAMLAPGGPNMIQAARRRQQFQQYQQMQPVQQMQPNMVALARRRQQIRQYQQAQRVLPNVMVPAQRPQQVQQVQWAQQAQVQSSQASQSAAYQHLAKEYSIHSVLGSGSFGKVYKAQHRTSGRVCAIKVTRTDRSGFTPTSIGSAARKEFSALHRLKDHANILQGFTHHEIPPIRGIAIVTELVDGTLDDMHKHRQATSNLCMTAFRHMLRAIAHMNSHGLVHRDLHRGNVFYQRSRSTGGITFKLADFGLVGEVGTRDGKYGCVAVMPPELIMDLPPTPTSDVWSLFVTIAEVMGVVDTKRGTTALNVTQSMYAALANSVMGNFVDCLQNNPRNRPMANVLLQRFG